MKSVKVFAPASVGNVSCGFDVFGFAIDAPGDTVTLDLIEGEELVITEVAPATLGLPLDPQKNTAGVAIQSFLRSIGKRVGIRVKLEKGLPVGSGMGSSAASAVAAVFAANHLLGSPSNREDLIIHALEAERVACGSAHADNVAPCLLGGFTLVRSNNPIDVVKIPIAAELWCAIVHPHFEVKTKDARSILPELVSLKDAVTQSANAAALIAGLMKPDYDLIGRSLVDVLAEPKRAGLIPDFQKIKSDAIRAGALGCGISGSGPTLFALCKSKSDAMIVGDSITRNFELKNLKSDLYISQINQKGATVIE